jgi:putative serine protease PepD
VRHVPKQPPSLWTDHPAGSDHEWLARPPRDTAARPLRPAPPPEEPPRRRKRPWWLALAALVLLLVGIGGAALADALFDSGQGSDTVAPLPAAAGRPAETRISEIYARASAGVVFVEVGGGTSGGRASGTGFVIDADGTLVTNAHVIGSARTAQVRFDDGERPVPAEVIGADPSSDLAVLRVDPSDVDRLQALPLADSDAVVVGDTAIAIGYPLGLDRTATAGIVSGLRREIQAPNGFRIDEVIQTDAPINPGNSGGPLLDSQGRVIGVNSQIAATGGGGNVGIGFAVPSNTVRTVVPQLKAGRTIERAFLGVATSPPVRGRGAVVREVTPGGPAAGAGVRAAKSPDGSDGDVIVSVDGRDVADPEDVAEAIESRRPGDEVEVVVRRRGGRKTIDVELGRRPQSSQALPGSPRSPRGP